MSRPPREPDPDAEPTVAWDPNVRRQLAELLAQDPELTLLDQPIFELLGPETPAPVAGERLGPYRLERELGRGGIGAVFLAVRADAPDGPKVAVKVLKHGMDSDEILRRFSKERQILARLDHPNVVRFYDGGFSDDQRPYLVMEHVDGVPIDRFCQRAGLDLRARLALFLKVCAGVQLAHQSLVIHRDLKPSNLLVTAAGEPKILDFGIAKLLDPEGTGATTLTATAAPMTPEYASPEQVLGEPVTTATDVYSLGVVLCELLTGRRPSPARRALETPNEPRRLPQRLDGDLDPVVEKALSLSPRERYASVEQLAQDLGRYLHGRPVEARQGTFFYRASKFVRRHPRAIALLVGVIMALAGLAVARELEQRRTARERDRARQVAAFLTELFDVSQPGWEEGDRANARKLLDRGAERIGAELAGQPDLQADLLLVIGRSYDRLGFFETAVPLLENSLRLRRRLYGEEHVEVAERLGELAAVYVSSGNFERAEALYRETLALNRKLLGEEDRRVASNVAELAAVRMDQGDYAESEMLFRQALRMLEQNEEVSRSSLVVLEGTLANVLYYRGDYPAAEAIYRRALASARALHDDDHPQVCAHKLNLATCRWAQGDHADAERLILETLASYQRIHGPQHPALVVTIHKLALVELAKGALEPAQTRLDEAEAMALPFLDDAHPTVAQIRLTRAQLLLARGGSAETALELARGARAALAARLGSAHWRVPYADGIVGAALGRLGRRAEAEALLGESYHRLAAQITPAAWPTRETAAYLAELRAVPSGSP